MSRAHVITGDHWHRVGEACNAVQATRARLRALWRRKRKSEREGGCPRAVDLGLLARPTGTRGLSAWLEDYERRNV
jgi:hypothetical protein